MHVFSGVLDEDFLVELPPKSISEHVIFKIFLGACSPDSPSFGMLYMLVVQSTTSMQIMLKLRESGDIPPEKI